MFDFGFKDLAKSKQKNPAGYGVSLFPLKRYIVYILN